MLVLSIIYCTSKKKKTLFQLEFDYLSGHLKKYNGPKGIRVMLGLFSCMKIAFVHENPQP